MPLSRTMQTVVATPGDLRDAKAAGEGDRVNLSKAELNELLEEVSGLARAYREGMTRHVKGR